MKCLKCKTDNNETSSYCYRCGNKFTEEEIKKAKNKGITGLIRKILKIKSYYKFSNITGKLWFKITTVVIILGIGMFNIISNGTKFRIIENDNYRIEYNQKSKEYYLFTNKNMTPLSLYVPGDNEKVTMKYYDENNNLLETKNLSKDNNFLVTTNSIYDNYYKVFYQDEEIVFRVYYK